MGVVGVCVCAEPEPEHARRCDFRSAACSLKCRTTGKCVTVPLQQSPFSSIVVRRNLYSSSISPVIADIIVNSQITRKQLRAARRVRVSHVLRPCCGYDPQMRCGCVRWVVRSIAKTGEIKTLSCMSLEYCSWRIYVVVVVLDRARPPGCACLRFTYALHCDGI